MLKYPFKPFFIPKIPLSNPMKRNYIMALINHLKGNYMCYSKNYTVNYYMRGWPRAFGEILEDIRVSMEIENNGSILEFLPFKNYRNFPRIIVPPYAFRLKLNILLSDLWKHRKEWNGRIYLRKVCLLNPELMI